MSVKATGQITLMDLTDGQLSVYLSSNLPKTQIYNKKEKSFSPDWGEANLQIVPNVSLNQRSISLDKVTVTYKKQIGETETDLDSSYEKVSNGILTVNKNILNESENKTITYIAYVTYNKFAARADLTFTLLNEGVDGEPGTSGESGYTFVLSNESYLFKGGTDSAEADNVNTTLSAYQGATEQRIKIVSVNGIAASASSISTGITGLNFKVSTIAETTSPVITFISSTALKQRNATLPISFQMNGKTWTKFFSYGIALQGSDAINYWMINSASAIKKSETNTFTPNQIVLQGKTNTGTKGVSDYYGRFVIEGSVDNNTWTTLYTSSANEISTTFTISNKDIIAYRCSMYLAGGTTTLLDRQIIPVVIDGKKGIDGAKGADGISTYFYIKYSANSDGSSMTDAPTSTTKYMGVCSTTAATAPTAPSAYTWSEIRGKDGQNGSPGSAGADGKTSYLHIKYSNDGLTFTDNKGETIGTYIGTLVDFIEEDSMTFSDYTWKKFVGDDAKSLTLYSSAYVVPYDSYGKLKNTDLITLTAVQQNFEDTVTWTTTPSVTLGSTGLTKTLNPNVFDNIDKLTITITASTFTDTITITKISDGNNSNSVGARSSNYNAADKESAVFINGKKVVSLIQSDSTRGHTLCTIDKDSLLLKTQKTYDTYGTPSLASTLAEDILKVTEDIIVLVTVDASTVNEDLREAIKSIGGSGKGTWKQQRVSQYVIGMPGLEPGKGYEQFSDSADTTLITVIPVATGTGIILNGTNTYTHIKYSDDGGATFTYPDSIVSKNINDWVMGQYALANGAYEATESRICFPELVKVETNLDYYFNTYNDDFHFVLRLYDKDKNFVSSRGAMSNGSYALINYEGYFGLSIAKNNGNVTFSDYVALFEEGNIVPVVCLQTKSGRGDSKGDYLGVYYDNINEDSANPARYTWSKIGGEDGQIVEPDLPANSYTFSLTNETQTIYADNDGTVSASEIAKIQSGVKIFNGSEECVTGNSGANQWEKTIWNNKKTLAIGTSVADSSIIPVSTKFTSDKVQLLSALTKISTTAIDDYVVPNSSFYIEGNRVFYVGRITTYIYCSRDYNVTHKMFHDDSMTMVVNNKVIFYRGHYVFEENVPVSFQKGYNKVDFYWVQHTANNGVGFYNTKLSDMDFVEKMNCYGNRHYDLIIKSQTPNIGATINSTKTGFTATSIPKDSNSGNVVLQATMFDGTVLEKEFNWTKAKKGDTGKDGTDGLTVILTNENHSFPATNNAATASSTSTQVLAFKGNAETTIEIKTVNGKTASTSFATTGIAGLNFKVSSTSAVKSPTITFDATTALVTQSGTIPITMIVNGQTLTKNFSFSLALKGNPGEQGEAGQDAYLVDINPSAQLFKSTDGGVKFSPDTITLTPRFQNVSFGSWEYSLNGGTSWTTITNTTANPTNCSYSPTTFVLTIPKGFSMFSSTITAITFKCVSSISTVYDTITIAKLYDVTDLQVGGKNLLRFTKTPKPPYFNATGTATEEVFNGCKVHKTNTIWQGIRFDFASQIDDKGLAKSDDTFTYSIWARTDETDETKTIEARFTATGIKTGETASSNMVSTRPTKGDATITSTWKKFYYTFTMNPDYLKVRGGSLGATRIEQNVSNTTGCFVYWACPKLEKGTVATDWSPAPEDTEEQLEGKVERTNIKAAINASGETVKIEATNVDLEGYVTITSLAGDSTTVINGSNITTGVIKSSNYAQNTIDKTRLPQLNDDLSGATLNTSFAWDTQSFFLDKDASPEKPGILLFKTATYYVIYKPYYNHTDSGSFLADTVEIRKNDGTLLETLYNSTAQYGIETNLTTYVLPEDAGRVIYINSSNKVYKMITAKMVRQVATAGMKITLSTGEIDTKNFTVDEEGNIYISGKVKSKQDNIILNTDVFDILNDYGDLLLELNSYGMDFYDGSSDRLYVGFIGHGTQKMTTIKKTSSTGIEYELVECDGLMLAAYPQEDINYNKNYFIGLGLGNENKEVTPLIQAYGYPPSDVATEFYWTVDIGNTDFGETGSSCFGLRIESTMTTAFNFYGGSFVMWEDPGDDIWYMESHGAKITMAGPKGNTEGVEIEGNKIRLNGQVIIDKSTYNGNYNSLLIGDDCYIGDCNQSNSIGLMGIANNNHANIVLGKGGARITGVGTRNLSSDSYTEGPIMHGRGGAGDHLYSCSWGSSLQFYVDVTNVANVSDRRLKTDFAEISDKWLDVIDSLNIQQFKIDNRNGLVSFGVIAQDLIAECEKRNIQPFDYEILQKIQYRLDDETIYYKIDYTQYANLKFKANERKIQKLEQQIAELRELIK